MKLDADPRLRTALAQAMELGEVGVQVAAYLGEDLIVDACIGVADTDSGALVQADTLSRCFP